MARSDSLYTNKRSPRSGEQREAKKGDVREEDKEIQDGLNKIEFKGTYESVGFEGRKEGDPDHISDADNKEMSRDLSDYRAGGKKGPTPSFKASPKEGEGKDETGRERYEIWRRRKREVPTS